MKGGFVDTITTIFKAVVALIVVIISSQMFAWNLAHFTGVMSLFSILMNITAGGWGFYYAFSKFKMLTKIEDL